MASDPRTDHPPLGDFLIALTADFAQALRANPEALAEIDLTVPAKVWGQVPAGQPAGTPPDVLIDFTEPGPLATFTIRLRPSLSYQTEQEELARERVAELQSEFVKRIGQE